MGIQSYLLKPVREKRLFDTITHVMSHPDNQRRPKPEAADIAASKGGLSDQDTDDVLSAIVETEILDAAPNDGAPNDMVHDDMSQSAIDDLSLLKDISPEIDTLDQPPNSAELQSAPPQIESAETIEPQNPDLVDILVAEDFELNRDVVSLMLAESKFRITFADNGKDAYDIYSKDTGRFAAILMDISMPVMDGYQSTKMIREFEARHKLTKTPIIALTGHALTDDRNICLEAGMDDYLTKPIKQMNLLEKLQSFTDRSNITAPNAGQDTKAPPNDGGTLDIDIFAEAKSA